jgi:hypothetical protein
MPKRQNIYTYNSEEVQGEGSWVKIRAMTYGRQKELREAAAEAKALGQAVKSGGMTPEEMEAALQDGGAASKLLSMNDELLIELVYSWNWVDEDGEPLPLPEDEPEIIQGLTIQEMQFLSEAIKGNAGLKK